MVETQSSSGSKTKKDSAVANAADTIADSAADIKEEIKEQYTKGLEEIQRIEGGFARAADHLGQAVATGFSTYRQRRDESAADKPDGALIDVFENVTKSVEEAVIIAAKAPYEVVSSIKPKKILRNIPPFSLFSD